MDCMSLKNPSTNMATHKQNDNLLINDFLQKCLFSNSFQFKLFKYSLYIHIYIFYIFFHCTCTCGALQCSHGL